MGKLYHLVYSSKRAPHCSDEEIKKILASCKKNNPLENVTGILIHSDNRFIQYIEGDKNILKLYDKIKEDDRHYNVRLLGYRTIKNRIFPSWQMGFKNIEKLGFNTDISKEDIVIFNNMINGDTPEQNIGISLLKRFFEKA
ncbi:BLUF domain-containing protein [Fulvivirga sp. M361]|uniref:BLUF domain-containing protein n=1 Tax=Fulvivirga sp. M361 TaxID=2594266 RepID=UPI00117B8A8D|nr:BLUF domain-containing protein [Fulvivirga sp. M361]TRX51871.1 BLUF domain-containing protein [Fulvivirga sp. M361]